MMHTQLKVRFSPKYVASFPGFQFFDIAGEQKLEAGRFENIVGIYVPLAFWHIPKKKKKKKKKNSPYLEKHA